MPAHRTLYLHVGHGKTGSSYLQSAFAEQREQLSALGIDYPLTPQELLDATTSGRISSGNPSHLLYLEPQSLPIGSGHLLFSFENFLEAFLEGRVDRLDAFCEYQGITDTRILLFTRNPISHLCSEYQQHIKRNGATFSLDEYTEIYDMPERVAAFLRLLGPRADTELTVLNYSRRSGDMLRPVEQWLGIPADTLFVSHRDTINRSLTPTELVFARELNLRLGHTSQDIIADPLCHQLPNVAVAELRPGVELQQRVCDRLAPAMREVDLVVGQAQSYQRDIAPGAAVDDAALALSREQIGVIADGLSSDIRRLDERIAELEQAYAELSEVHAFLVERWERTLRSRAGRSKVAQSKPLQALRGRFGSAPPGGSD